MEVRPRHPPADDPALVQLGRLRDELLRRFEERVRRTWYPSFAYEVVFLHPAELLEVAEGKAGAVREFPWSQAVEEGLPGCRLLERVRRVLREWEQERENWQKATFAASGILGHADLGAYFLCILSFFLVLSFFVDFFPVQKRCWNPASCTWTAASA